jgi:hypothetical protein
MAATYEYLVILAVSYDKADILRPGQAASEPS